MAEKSGGSGHSGSKAGQHGGGNLKNDPKRASEAGKKGGEHALGGGSHERGGSLEEHVKAGQQSHKNK